MTRPQLLALLLRLRGRYRLTRADQWRVNSAISALTDRRGRPATVDVELAKRLRASGKSLREIGREMGVSHTAIGMAVK